MNGLEYWGKSTFGFPFTRREFKMGNSSALLNEPGEGKPEQEWLRNKQHSCRGRTSSEAIEQQLTGGGVPSPLNLRAIVL